MSLSKQSLEILFVINPVSARGKTPSLWREARKRLKCLGIHGMEHVTSRPGDATEVTRQALKSGVKRVVAVGGDGTANEVLNGYFDLNGIPHNPHADIALVPSGNGNDFRRSLGPRSWEDAVAAITRPQSDLLDAAVAQVGGLDGGVCSRYLLNVATIGLGGMTAELVNRWRPRIPGWIHGRLPYLAAVVWALGKSHNRIVEVCLDKQPSFVVQSNIIGVANGRFTGGGMMVAPGASLRDGLLDIILADRVGRWGILKQLPRIPKGGHLDNPKFREEQAQEVLITSEDPMPVEIDGEVVGMTPVSFRILPSAVRFVI